MLETGQTAPAFTLQDQNEQPHNLKDFAGQWVLLYFYPKDDTPGCTQEACTIAEVYTDFQNLGVVVLGVSKDTPASHKEFAEKYNLPFTLLSDSETVMMKAYGALDENGTHRITYLINPDGEVAKVYPEVDPANHAAELLADLQKLVT